MTEHEIYERLKPLLTEVLSIPQEKLQSGSVLMNDLGAESIDLLDLSFRIEETFNVRLESNELEREAGKLVGGPVYEPDGRLTDQALEALARACPGLDKGRLVKGLRKMDLPSLLTVEFFVKLIARKLVEKEGAHA
jgi:acyl carrier protein